MECKKWEEEGLLYTSGELTAEQSAQYTKHLSECDVCSKEYTEYRELVDGVIGGDFPMAELSDECDTRVKAAISEALTAKKKPRYILGMSFVSLLRRTTVAVAVVALSYFVTLQVKSSPSNSGELIAGKAESTISIKDSTMPDSLKKFQEGSATGIKSVNVREE